MKVGQSRRASFAEAWINIFIGYAINFTANMLIFPRFGYQITVRDNLIIGVIYTVISLVRGYGVRRLFNWIHIRETR